METCKPTSTPSKPHTQLLVDEGTPVADPTHYKSIVGALQYLTLTRPDIGHSVNMVGDLGYIGEDGPLYVVDRIKELIKYKGFQKIPLTEEDAKSFIDSQVASFKRLRRVTFINSVSTSPSGKILRRELIEKVRSEI
ncbi:probable CoA ligase CCL7 [Malus sylvestris]|uniref:probable CoA ligase CCL7 n=1 Tax=Malus sylvestris TaxID=3752 RepID=UPI0021AC6166|nr:probable CoA ligase CCL7 [Malus sylvestris]